MVQVDDRVARCFALLRSPEFHPLINYLQKRRQETLERLGEVTGEEMKSRLQGRQQELKEILELVVNAERLVAVTKRL